MLPWLLTMAMEYPSVQSCFSVPGTLTCHHFQSLASLAKMLPDEVEIKVESKSKAAIFLLLTG